MRNDQNLSDIISDGGRFPLFWNTSGERCCEEKNALAYPQFLGKNVD